MAAGAGYDTLEVAAWPVGSPHRHQASHINVDQLSVDDVSRIQDLVTRHNLTLSAISCYENNLHSNDTERARIHDHLRACIRAAAALKVNCVGTFIGRDASLPMTDNLKRAEQHLAPLVTYAAEHNVRLVIENCPMEGRHPDGYPGNLAYSPELWDWMFELGLFLNYDPSHLLWLGIDPIDALKPCLDANKVLHVQAKDIEINPRQRTRYGIFGKTVTRTTPEDVGWWRYRVPGRGQLDWNHIIDTLYAGGFDGTVAVEHEDPVWSGSNETIEQGLIIAASTLRPLIVATPDRGATQSQRRCVESHQLQVVARSGAISPARPCGRGGPDKSLRRLRRIWQFVRFVGLTLKVLEQSWSMGARSIALYCIELHATAVVAMVLTWC